MGKLIFSDPLTHTWQKKSCRIMSSSRGLFSGFLANMLLMRCLACGDRDEGMEYRASRMHLYVSFRFVVSNGGRPRSMVYLRDSRNREHVCQKRAKSSTVLISHLHDTAQGPDVRFAAVPLLVQDLGRQVVRRSAYRFPAVLDRFEFRRQTKVADLEFHRLVDEKITCEE